MKRNIQAIKSWTLFVLSILFIALPWSAEGGGWVSSGGDLVKDEKNPWFIQNTKEVFYCVEVDEASISISKSEVQTLISRAFAYWKNEFALIDKVLPPSSMFGDVGIVHVGTQTFTEVSCTEQVSLKFKIGYDTLDKKQIAYIKTPEQYLGLTVRTDYDQKQLRGQGFIFIASDKGPHQYRASKSVAQPWSYQGILYRLLIHELGHVFGIPHISSPPMDFKTAYSEATLVMDERFPQNMIDPAQYRAYTEVKDLGRFFFPPSQISFCGPTPEIEIFFELNAQEQCVDIGLEEVLQENRVTFKATPMHPQGTKQERVLFSVTPKSNQVASYQLQSILSFYPPEGQQVFPKLTLNSQILMPYRLGLSLNLDFPPSSDGKSRSIFLKSEPANTLGIGAKGGKIIPFEGNPFRFLKIQ